MKISISVKTTNSKFESVPCFCISLNYSQARTGLKYALNVKNWAYFKLTVT